MEAIKRAQLIFIRFTLVFWVRESTEQRRGAQFPLKFCPSNRLSRTQLRTGNLICFPQKETNCLLGEVEVHKGSRTRGQEGRGGITKFQVDGAPL